MNSPVYCNHANEVPSLCVCPKDCYCYTEGDCQSKTFTNDRCSHLEHAMVVGPGPHICETCQIKALKEELKAAKEIWCIAQRGCAKHARQGDKLETTIRNCIAAWKGLEMAPKNNNVQAHIRMNGAIQDLKKSLENNNEGKN